MRYHEGEMRLTPALEHKTGDIIPIAVERYEGGKWQRIGYACGNSACAPILSIEEWKQLTATRAPEH